MISDNLIAYWRLDESSGNASDSVGSRTATNTSVTYATGKIGNGAVFNGTSSTMSFSAFTTLTTTFSINCWVNFSGVTGNQIFFMAGTSGAGAIYISRMNASGNLTFTEQAVADYDSGTVLPATGWNMVTVVKNGDGANNLTQYINGVQTATTNSVGSVAAGAGTGYFGSFNGTSNWFNGTLDEVGVWTKALYQLEISQLYADGGGSQYQLFESKKEVFMETRQMFATNWKQG